MKETKNRKLTFASLFSGIGGADIADTAAGYRSNVLHKATATDYGTKEAV